MMIQAIAAPPLRKVATGDDRIERMTQGDDFPEVSLVPGLKASLSAGTYYVDDDGKVIPGTKGHIHHFCLDLEETGGDYEGWIHFSVCDLDGPVLTEAVTELEAIQKQIDTTIEQLIHLPAANYPYPPQGWNDAAIEAYEQARKDEGTDYLARIDRVTKSTVLQLQPTAYFVNEDGSPDRESEGHIYEARVDLPQVDVRFHSFHIDDRNGPPAKQAADRCREIAKAFMDEADAIERREVVTA